MYVVIITDLMYLNQIFKLSFFFLQDTTMLTTVTAVCALFKNYTTNANHD